jgi:hypothetical protein
VDGLFDGKGVEWSDLARLKSLQNQQKSLDNQKSLLDAIHKQNALQKEESTRQRNLPTCPLCGGTLAGRSVTICPHCRSHIYWGPSGPFGSQEEASDDQARCKKKAELEQQKAELEKRHRAEFDRIRDYVKAHPWSSVDQVLDHFSGGALTLSSSEVHSMAQHWVYIRRMDRLRSCLGAAMKTVVIAILLACLYWLWR